MPEVRTIRIGRRAARALSAALLLASGAFAPSFAAAATVAPVGACEGNAGAALCPGPAAAAPAASSAQAATTVTERFTPASAFVKGRRITVFTPKRDVGPIFRIARVRDKLWFTESRASLLVKMSANGFAAYYPTLAGSEQPHGITLGPDGAVWFSEFVENVGRATGAGVQTEYPADFDLQSNDIKTGSDGALWFPTDFHGIGRVTTDGVITFFNLPDNTVQPATIARGEDGNIWFVESDGVGVGKITPAGAVTVYPTGFHGLSARWGIVQGPDHRIWFTDQAGKRIGAIRLNGTGLEFYSKGISAGPLGLVVGPDGNLYFSETNVIARITPAGRVTEYPIPASLRQNRDFPAYGMTVGPDGNIWFVNSQHTQVGRLKVN